MPIERRGTGAPVVSISVVLMADWRGARIWWCVGEVLPVGSAELRLASTSGDSR